MKHALLLINRHARQGDTQINQVVEQLQKLGLSLVEASTEDPENLTSLLRQYQPQVDLVIIGGGDGTLNAAIEGLIEVQLPLGILPMGTANDLARTLGLPTDLSAACRVIAEGYQARIDLGWVNGKHFFNVASLGLSVQITRKLNKQMKQRWGILAYAIAAIQVLLQSRPFTVQLRLNQGEWIQMRTIQVAVGNGRYYGGGMAVAERATIDDQRLDVYSLNIRRWWQLLVILPGMRSGNHTSWKFVEHYRCYQVEIQTRRPYAINTDGEITTATPAHFRVIPQAISVFVPASKTIVP